MKSHVITAIVVGMACQSLAASASLSSADIQAEIERAAKEYLGDPPSGVAITSRYARPSCGADDFPRANISVKLGVPHPAPSQMLVVIPNSIELFVSP